jgi:hypothetical protein
MRYNFIKKRVWNIPEPVTLEKDYQVIFPVLLYIHQDVEEPSAGAGINPTGRHDTSEP